MAHGHRTLVVGLAGRGSGWARQVQSHPHFSLTGIADIKEQVLRQRAEELGLSQEACFTDYKKALASGKFDVVVLATPTYLHYQMTRDVLEGGLHCLVEKPFTLELTQAEELVELAEKKLSVLEVVQNYRFKPACRLVEKIISEGTLGQLSSVEGRFHRFRPPRYEEEQKLPYPQLFIQAIHHLDWLVAVLPSRIARVLSRHRRPPWSLWDYPAISHIIIECEDGVLVSYVGSYESRGEISSYEGLWRFEFERGDLTIDSERNLWLIADKGERKEKLFDVQLHKDTSGDRDLLDTLHEAISTGREPPTSGRKNLETLRLLFEVIESGEEGLPRSV